MKLNQLNKYFFVKFNPIEMKDTEVLTLSIHKFCRQQLHALSIKVNGMIFVREA